MEPFSDRPLVDLTEAQARAHQAALDASFEARRKPCPYSFRALRRDFAVERQHDLMRYLDRDAEDVLWQRHDRGEL